MDSQLQFPNYDLYCIKKLLIFNLDGEVRPARGTTLMKYVPQSQHPQGIRPSSKKVATFYDLEKKDWRSVSQRSKEIVLDKDEETGKPVIMVKDKPEGGDVAIKPKGEEIPSEEPTEQPIEQPVEQPITEPGEVDQPELDIDGNPVDIDTKQPVAHVEKVKPIESTDQTMMYHFVNAKTGASRDIEMVPKEVIKELKRMGRGWELSEEPEFAEKENRIQKSNNEEGDYLQVGDKRNYLNRKGENVEVEITGEDPTTGSFFAKGPGGAEFKIPANRMQNIGQHIKEQPIKTKVKPKGIIDKGRDLENIEADQI